MKKILLLVLFSVFLSCTTSKSAPSFSNSVAPEIKKDKAILYIFRSHAEPTAFASYLKIDKIEAASLNQEGFTWVYVEPGQHDFEFGWPFLSGMPSVIFRNSLEAGKVYAFQMSGSVKSSGSMINSTSAIVPISIETATEKMKACCRYVPSKYKRK